MGSKGHGKFGPGYLELQKCVCHRVYMAYSTAPPSTFHAACIEYYKALGLIKWPEWRGSNGSISPMPLFSKEVR